MRVGIDASYLLTPRKSGVETYTLNLLRALLALDDRPEVFLYAAGPEVPPDAREVFAAADRVRYSPIPRLWLRARMPLWMARDRIDVAHFPGTLLPTWLPCPAVTTFYDLAAMHYPELYDPAELKHYERLIPQAAQRSAAILAISECTKRDVVRFFGVPETKVIVTPLGVDPRFRPIPDAAQIVQQQYGLPQPYILACVGSGHPRKNLAAVVRAFGRLTHADLRLAIVGAADRDNTASAAIATSPNRDRIALLGHVPEDALPAIYSAATVFCFPSLYEGFGLPVLEAMSCATPVVCSNTSSLPEVLGDAGVMVEPTDEPALAEAIEGLLADEERRERRGRDGQERARQFTWERCARGTVEGYEAARRGRR